MFVSIYSYSLGVLAVTIISIYRVIPPDLVKIGSLKNTGWESWLKMIFFIYDQYEALICFWMDDLRDFNLCLRSWLLELRDL